MSDIKNLLDSCPYMDGYSVDELVGLQPGVFSLGVVGQKTDILGDIRCRYRYSLRKRCPRGSSWAQQLTDWLLSRGIAVTGGKLSTPANDTTGIYELTIEL